jgi:YD repeat-containing protein
LKFLSAYVPVLRWPLFVDAPVQLRYRLAGGAWTDLSIVNEVTGATESGTPVGTQYARLDSIPAGTYEFQLLAIEDRGTRPTSQATGTVTINAAVPGYYETRNVQVQVPYTVTPPDPSNYIIGWTGVGPTYGPPVVVGYDWAGNPICGHGYSVVWNYSESGATYGGIVAVPYTAYRTETRTETVPVQVIVGWVPQIIGYDESNTPIYAYNESGIIYNPVYETRWETRTVTVQVPYTVYPPDPSNYIISPHSGNPIYGSPVVVGRDESGNTIYGFGYGVVNGSVVSIPYTAYRTETQPQQFWVPGYTPDPTWVNTTPPFTPAYWIPAQPTRYAASVSTPASSVSTSLSGSAAGATMTQAMAINGSSANVRPSIQQTLDRWGNVVTVSDPRSAYWLTRYRYNANNQRIQETRPDSNGATSANSPTTNFYFDRLGRQVAVKDANGNVNGQQWDAGSNLVQETHADGGVVSYAFNAFGEKLRMTDELGKATVYTYDRLSRLTATTRGVSNVYTVNGANALQFVATRALVDSAIYDAAGRKLSQTNGDGETTTYRYDARGQVIATIQPGGLVSRTAYDSNGRTVGETNQNGALATWGYDYFGQLQARRDIGGATYGYTYDRTRQLVRQTNTRGQDLRMTYDAAGQLLRQQDVPQDKLSIFEYDRAGRHVREVTIQAGVFYQDNRLAYDALGRLRSVADSRVNLLIDYDRNGNRTRIRSSVIDSTGVLRYQDRYFAYDAMNRQTLVDGLNAAGAIGAGQGHRITYDKAGNRKTDTFWGNRVTTVNGSTQIAGYDESGGAIYSTTPTTWTTTQGESTETYAYDNNGRLSGVVRDGVQIDHRFYDGAGRVVQTGPNGNLPQGYAAALNQGVASGVVNGLETRINRFDDNGRLLHQRVLKSDNAAKYEIAYSSYDPAGNLLRYTLTNQDGTAYTNTYAYSYETREAYQESRIDGTSTRFNAGASVTAYDANGFQKSFTDTTAPANNRNFVTDAAGRVLWENQAGHVDRQLIVNGEVLGRFGDAIDEVNPRDGSGNPQFKQVADFNFGYQPINGNYPSASPGTYRVRAGDTLASIARGAYGDSKLWYRIAEANGISGDRDLRVGQTLSVPAGVGTVHNDGDSFKPYDPSKITGDTTPNLPTPSGGGGCGGLGLVLVVIVAVAVTVVTAGAAAIAMGAVTTSTVGAGLGQIAAAGAAVATGTTVAGVSVAGAGFMAAGAAAIGGAAGSIASQGVAIAMGMQESLNWRQVGLSAVGSAIGSGIGKQIGAAAHTSNAISMQRVAQTAFTGAMTQAVGVATGLQDSFNWRGVAASAIGSAIGQGVSSAMDAEFGRASGDFMERVARGTVSGIAAGAAAAIARGGRVVVQQVAADAFGNALGQGLVDEMQRTQSDALTKQIQAGTDAKSQLAQEFLKRGMSPEQSMRAAGSMVSYYGEDGVSPLLNAGAGSGKTTTPAWQPTTDAQRSAYDNAKAQLLEAGMAPDAAANKAADVARLVAIKEQVDGLRSGVDRIRQTDPALARQIETFGPAFDRALIAKDVYFNRSIQELLPAGVSRIDGDKALAGYGLSAAALNDNDQSGYFGALYRRASAGGGSDRLFYANRGTEMDSVSAAIKDWQTNLLQGSGEKTPQYSIAIDNARTLKSGGFDVEYIGHSLGGGLAMAQALVTGSKATVFNPAAVHLETIRPYGANFSRANELITAYNLNGDILNFTQDGGKLGLATLVRQGLPAIGSLGGPVGSAMGRLVGNLAAEKIANMPAVQADRYRFPAAEAPIQAGGALQYGATYTQARTYNPATMVGQHLMDTMIWSMASRLRMTAMMTADVDDVDRAEGAMRGV